MLKTRTIAAIAAITMAATAAPQASAQSNGTAATADNAGFVVLKRIDDDIGDWARSPFRSMPKPKYEFRTPIGGAAGSFVETFRQIRGWDTSSGACLKGGRTLVAILTGKIVTQDFAQAYDGRRGWSDGNGFYDHDREFKKAVTITNPIDIKVENQTLIFSMRRNSVSMRIQNMEDRFKNEIERTVSRRFNNAKPLRFSLTSAEVAQYETNPDNFIVGLKRFSSCPK